MSPVIIKCTANVLRDLFVYMCRPPPTFSSSTQAENAWLGWLMTWVTMDNCMSGLKKPTVGQPVLLIKQSILAILIALLHSHLPYIINHHNYSQIKTKQLLPDKKIQLLPDKKSPTDPNLKALSILPLHTTHRANAHTIHVCHTYMAWVFSLTLSTIKNICAASCNFTTEWL